MPDEPPLGQCLFETVFVGNDRKFRIVRADQRVRIAQGILDTCADELHPDVSYGDGILTIRAINGTVSYGVGPLDVLTLTREGVKSP